MAWLELHQSVRDHRKVVHLAEVLDMPEPHVVGHLSYLWLWAIDNAPSGVLPRSPRVIARAAWWEGDPQAFIAALVEVGLIDQADENHLLHDWDDYAGKLIAQRDANRNRQQRHRDRSRDTSRDVTPVKIDTEQTVTVTSPLRNGATEQNSTQHNTTEDPPTPHGGIVGDADGDDGAVPSVAVVDEPEPTEPDPKPSVHAERFDAFWASYPRKVGKDAARTWWMRRKPSASLTAEIMTGLDRSRGGTQWQRDGGQYIPHPTTWLREGRWQDGPEPDVPPPQPKNMRVVQSDDPNYYLSDTWGRNRRTPTPEEATP